MKAEEDRLRHVTSLDDRIMRHGANGRDMAEARDAVVPWKKKKKKQKQKEGGVG